MAIVGVSFDDPAKNQEWAEKEGFTFELWADDDRTLALAYGAASSASQPFADRVTKVLDDQGNLILEYPKVSVGVHPGQVLSDCQVLFGAP